VAVIYEYLVIRKCLHSKYTKKFLSLSQVNLHLFPPPTKKTIESLNLTNSNPLTSTMFICGKDYSTGGFFQMFYITHEII
jgi:hypothetical protein